MSDSDVHDTTGPGTSISNADLELAERLTEVVDSLPTLTEKEIADRHAPRSVHRDEFGAGLWTEQYRPAALDLPGFGEEREDCGAEIPHVCEGCGKSVEIGRTCAQSTCPRCAPKWVLNRAPGIVSKIMGAAKMKDGAQYKHHVAVSPPADLFVDEDHPEQAIGRMLQQFMAEIDMDGVILYHPYSGKSDDETGFAENHNDDRGEWKHRLFEGRSWGDVRDELQHRPHFHIIGTCNHFPGGDVTAELYRRTGWVFHRITERNGSPVSLGDMNAVARAVCYAISHTGIDTREDGLGGESNRYLKWRKGSAYDAHDGRNIDAAREAVYRVAPDVLGIPSMDVSCRSEVPEDECEHDHDHIEDLDGDGGLEDGSTSTTEPGMTTCKSALVDVDDADFVEDENWQRSALYYEEAVEARQKWDEAGGWQGWSGQATISDVEDPPG